MVELCPTACATPAGPAPAGQNIPFIPVLWQSRAGDCACAAEQSWRQSRAKRGSWALRVSSPEGQPGVRRKTLGMAGGRMCCQERYWLCAVSERRGNICPTFPGIDSRAREDDPETPGLAEASCLWWEPLSFGLVAVSWVKVGVICPPPALSSLLPLPSHQRLQVVSPTRSRRLWLI